MKKAVCIAVCLWTLLLVCGCGAKEQNDMENKNVQTVTIVNDVRIADVWILSDTQQNRKTTVWGTATAAGVKTGESRQAPLCEPGDDGLYLLRMIDTEGYFYSASGITLNAGWTIRVQGDELQTVTAEVADENGVLRNTYKVFSAKL